MATPKYVERISRLPGVFEHLLAHPDGMPLRELADDFHVDPEHAARGPARLLRR